MRDNFEILYNVIDKIKIVKNALKNCQPNNESYLEGQLSGLMSIYEYIFEENEESSASGE